RTVHPDEFKTHRARRYRSAEIAVWLVHRCAYRAATSAVNNKVRPKTKARQFNRGNVPFAPSANPPVRRGSSLPTAMAKAGDIPSIGRQKPRHIATHGPVGAGNKGYSTPPLQFEHSQSLKCRRRHE